MTRTKRWFTGIAVVAGLVAAALFVAASMLLPSDEKIAAALSARFEENFAIGLKIGSAQRSLWPVPTLVLNDLATAQPRPITAKRVTLRLRVAPLWHREIGFEAVDVESAVFPSASVRAFRGRGGADKPEDLANKHMPSGWTLASTPVEHLRLRDVGWIDRRDIALVYDGDVTFDANWRPQAAAIQRPGVQPVTQARAERIGSDEDRWRVFIDVGGGTLNGQAKLDSTPAGLTVSSKPKKSTSRACSKHLVDVRRWPANCRAPPRSMWRASRSPSSPESCIRARSSQSSPRRSHESISPKR